MKRGPAWRRGAVVLALVLLAPAGAGAAPDGSFWGRVAGAAGAGRPPAADGAEKVDIARVLERADGEENAGRLESACAMLERALPRYAGAERAAAWFRLGIVRTRLGRYREAAAAYAAVGRRRRRRRRRLRQLRRGADGRRPVARRAGALPRRDLGRQPIWASAIGASGCTSWRSRTTAWRSRWIATSSRSPRARRCCARWRTIRTTAVLKIASTPGGDLFFVPDGDVLYYLGLAAEAEGRDGDAEAAFREFIARAPRSRWARAAEAHLGKKPARASGGAPRRRRGGRRASSRTAPCWRRAASPRRWSTPPGATSCRFSTNAWAAAPAAARDGAHRDRDGRRRARKTDARHREGAGAVRRAVCALRGIGGEARGCASRCPRPGRASMARTEMVDRRPVERSPRARSRCSQERGRRGIRGGRGAQREAALHRRRRADRRGQEQPRGDPGRRSCPRA